MAIDNGQSRETSNIGNTRHRAKANKAKHTKHRKLKSWPTRIPPKTGGEHAPSYKQLEVNRNRTSFLCGHRSNWL